MTDVIFPIIKMASLDSSVLTNILLIMILLGGYMVVQEVDRRFTEEGGGSLAETYLDKLDPSSDSEEEKNWQNI